MIFLDKLQKAIEKVIFGVKLKDIARAREEMSARYQNPGGKLGSYLTTDAERYAYLVTRLPATFTVTRRVFKELKEDSFETVLDLGAGPGSAMWSAADIFPHIKEFTLIEKDRALLEMGKRLASHHDLESVIKADWRVSDLFSAEFPEKDLTVMSYVTGEIIASSIETLVEKAWKSARKFLVVIEPGTPAGFERIRSIRSQLISLGGHVVAPCPHGNACPMSGGDWCHFFERLDRSSFHRQCKDGELTYEDEKYSYVIFSKEPHAPSGPRILRRRHRHTGHINFPTCSKDGLKEITVSKRTPDAYRRARKLDWGDAL